MATRYAPPLSFPRGRIRPDVRDRRQTSDKKHRLIPPPIRGGGIIKNNGNLNLRRIEGPKQILTLNTNGDYARDRNTLCWQFSCAVCDRQTEHTLRHDVNYDYKRQKNWTHSPYFLSLCVCVCREGRRMDGRRFSHDPT